MSQKARLRKKKKICLTKSKGLVATSEENRGKKQANPGKSLKGGAMPTSGRALFF